jgi:hypothetical protein
LTALRAIYGLPINGTAARQLVRDCIGRDPALLPPEGFGTNLLLVGRRSGKSRASAIMGAYEAALAGHERKLAPGERGYVPILAPSKFQSRVVTDYLRAIFSTPLLRNEVAAETRDGFELKSGTRIEILSGDWRTIRAYTLLAAIVDEACFFGVDAESKVKSDTELIRALKPGLATIAGSKLICISSPYARRGWCFEQHRRHYASNTSKTLVWNCPSRTMNPTLPQSVVDDAMAEDLAAAKSEYGGEFRDDISLFLPREVIEQLVVPGRRELLPDRHLQYIAFCDASSGRQDDAALAIAHADGRTVVLDCLKRWRPPFNPHEVIGQMAEELRRWGIKRITGDNYSANFVSDSFAACGVAYQRADKPKSQLYAELLPRLCSGEIELLDNETLVNQLAALERRTRSGGKDIIDHPSGGKDDLANACAGVAVTAGTPLRVVGPMWTN